ncbi:MAG: hypothetical protein OXF20_00680 [Gammaproteobacteria bacterium]|nr:hypothetical protein [Gammaproteobacteria bacterium]
MQIRESRRTRKKSIDKFIDAVYETYFQRLDKPLRWRLRVTYASLGALTLFVSGAFIVVDIDALLEIEGLITYVMPLFVLVISAFFGFLIAMAETRHGPVRLYISGLVLPAFVIVVIRNVFQI